MTKLYRISDPENKTDMLPKDDLGLVCPKCSVPLQDDYLNPKYKAPKRCPDISHTYDGHYIVSQQFRNVIASAGFDGLLFDALPASPLFFRLKLEKVLSFSRPAGLKFEEYCTECRRYKSVWGLDFVQVILSKPEISEGIYRSDIKMGYGRMMFYLLLATEEAKMKLKEAKLSGAYFHSIASKLA